MDINNKKIKITIFDHILKKDCNPYPNYYEFFKFKDTQKDYTFFVDFSIFDKEEYNNYKVKFITKFTNKDFNKLEKICIGSIVGMAIGDAIGARVEFLPLSYTFDKVKDMGNYPGGSFKLKPGQWTDDTSMGLCIADSLIEKKGLFHPRDIMMRFILWWFYGYNNAFRFDKERPKKHSVGLGGNIKGSICQYIKERGQNYYTKYGNRDTSGNGSIMRNAPIPICFFRDQKLALKIAKYQSLITHQGDEAAGCCQLLTFIIIKIINLKIETNLVNIKDETKTTLSDTFKNKKNYTLKDILNDLNEFKCDCESVNCLANSKQENNDINRNWDWKNDNFRYSEKRANSNPRYIGSYCMDGLSMALHVLYTTDTFEKAILKAVNLCGDADSVGSVVGQIAGAFYELDSIPKDWIKAINVWDQNEIALRGYILCHLYEKKEKKEKKESKESKESKEKIITNNNDAININGNKIKNININEDENIEEIIKKTKNIKSDIIKINGKEIKNININDDENIEEINEVNNTIQNINNNIDKDIKEQSNYDISPQEIKNSYNKKKKKRCCICNIF
jgi:ADP-ribosylglycohydrolase